MRIVEEVVHGRTVDSLVRRDRTIVELMQTSLTLSADDVLLIDPALQRSVTYGEFAQLIEGAAQMLRSRFRPGERIGVLVRNGLEAALATWACARADLIYVGLPVDLPAARLTELLELTSPVAVFAQPEFLDAVSRAEDARALLDLRSPWDFDRPLPDQDDTYALIATSGTTGRPKAVRITGRMATHAAEYYGTTLRLSPGDRTAIHLSFAWVSGHISQLAPAMRTGGSAVTMATFSPSQLVDVIRAHGVTWIDVVPSIWEGLLRTDAFTGNALPTLRAAIFGGAPAPAGTLERVRSRVPAMALFDVYAQSETCAPVTMLFDDDAAEHSGSVGRAAPHTQLRIVTADGAEATTGGIGELWVRSGSLTPGYWPPDVAPIDDEGWFRTGDLAAIDADGFLTTHGRAVDLIIRGGRNIFPAEVERALMATGLLADAAVVGVASKVSGQRVAAAVVPLPGIEASPSDLRERAASAIGNHAAPKVFRVVDDLPRNRNGKVDRVLVAKLFDRPE